MAIPEEHVSPEVLDAALEATTRLDQRLIREGHAPPFAEGVKAGVKWQPEPPGEERFDHAKTVLARKWGDCDDLAPWHAASLRESGQDPDATAVVRKSGPHRWHAIVQRSDGSLEDPSKSAGMKGREGIPPAVVGHMFPPSHMIVGEEMLQRPQVALVKHPRGGFAARCDMPMDDTDYALTALHRAPVAAQALVGAINGAIVVGECAGCAHEEHTRRLAAISGVLQGERRDALCHLCGEDAVLAAEEFASVSRVGPPPGFAVVKDKLDRIMQGERPEPGSLEHETYRAVSRMHPAQPGSAQDIANLLIADQASKHVARNLARQVSVTGHEYVSVGDLFGDIASIASKAAPALSTVANFIPGVGPAVSTALKYAGPALSAASSFMGNRPGSAPAPSRAPSAPPARAAYASAPSFASRPVAAPSAPPVPPVTVHMPAAPRGSAASAPVHVSAQPGGPVVIRF